MACLRRHPIHYNGRHFPLDGDGILPMASQSLPSAVDGRRESREGRTGRALRHCVLASTFKSNPGLRKHPPLPRTLTADCPGTGSLGFGAGCWRGHGRFRASDTGATGIDDQRMELLIEGSGHRQRLPLRRVYGTATTVLPASAPSAAASGGLWLRRGNPSRPLPYLRHQGSIRVPSTSRNRASHAGCAGQAGAVTSLPST